MSSRHVSSIIFVAVVSMRSKNEREQSQSRDGELPEPEMHTAHILKIDFIIINIQFCCKL